MKKWEQSQLTLEKAKSEGGVKAVIRTKRKKYLKTMRVPIIKYVTELSKISTGFVL